MYSPIKKKKKKKKRRKLGNNKLTRISLFLVLLDQIGLYILFHFVNLASSCSLIP